MKHLSNSLVTAALLLFLLPAEAQVRGNGNMVRQERDVPGFTGINVSSGIDVFIRQGSAPGLIIEAEENLQELIISEVQGDVLKIYVKEKMRIMRSEGMDAYITVTGLNSVKVSGGGDVESESLIETNQIAFDLSGGGDLEFDLSSGKTVCELSGGGDAQLTGKVGDFKVSLSGGGDLEMDAEVTNLSAELSGGGDADITAGGGTGDVKIGMSGGGDLDIEVDAGDFMARLSGGGDADISAGKNVTITDINIGGGGNLELETGTEKLRLNLSGGGDASLSGSAEDLVAEIRSGSDLSAEGFTVKQAVLTLSGGSDASIHVTGVLDVTVSGGGQVYVSGNPEIRNANLSGGSKLHER
jgi:hypothetical protein